MGKEDEAFRNWDSLFSGAMLNFGGVYQKYETWSWVVDSGWIFFPTFLTEHASRKLMKVFQKSSKDLHHINSARRPRKGPKVLNQSLSLSMIKLEHVGRVSSKSGT